MAGQESISCASCKTGSSNARSPRVTVIANADDRSTSIAPELLYPGINNVELRLRAFFLNGGAGTEFGERQNSRRIELQARLYF
jgi:hypothetical protein